MQDKQTANMVSILLSYFDEIKDLITIQRFSSILTDYSKNEILALLLLYRAETSTMSEIADYIGAPLNTATGVISRLEKKGIALRQRLKDDRRVVHISLTDYGKGELNAAIEQIMQYAGDVLTAFDDNEKQQLLRMVEKGITALRQSQSGNEQPNVKRVRKIIID